MLLMQHTERGELDYQKLTKLPMKNNKKKNMDDDYV